MHYRFEHEFDIDVASYWDLFFSDEYNDDLYRELKMKEYQLVEKRDDGKVLHRTLRITPATEIPSVFRSVLKDTSYTERDVFRREANAMDVQIEPAILKNKFDFRGVYSVLPAGEGRCKRVFEGDVKVSIMLLGGQIEKYMIEQLRTSYEVAYRVTKRWIERRKGGKHPQS